MEPNHLVRLSRLYAGHLGLSLATVSTYAQNDGKFFDRIVRTGNVTHRVANRLARWFHENWPADLEWPADIPRPTQKKEVA